MAELLPGPLGRGMECGVAMQDFPRPMFQDHEHIKDPERDCHGNEKIAGHDHPSVVLQEGAPPPVPARTGGRRLQHVFPDRPGRDLDTKFEEKLVGDPLLPPQRVFSRAIFRMRALSSAGTGGRPGFNFHLQNRRKASRCKRIRVAGLTTSKASFHLNSFERKTRDSLEAGSMRPGLV